MTPSMPANFTAGPSEFVCYARTLLVGQSPFGALAIAKERGYERAERILKSAVESGGTSDAAWASALMDHRIAVSGFVDSLRTASVFDAMYPAMRRVPMAQKAAVVTVAASGSVVGEMQLKPVSKLSLAELTLDARKAVAIIVISNELAKSAGAAGDALLSAELRGAVGSATDQAFLNEIAVGATSITSTGSSATAIYDDLGALLAAVPLGQGSRPHLVMSAASAAQLAVKATPAGQPSFPELGPLGGVIAGIPVVASDQLVGDSSGSVILLVDANQIAADMQTIVLDSSSVATIAMDSAPDSSSEQATTSLFQSNSSALKAERYFAFQRLRSSAVAVLTSVDYSVQS